MGMMKRPIQRAMHCRCGNRKILARGLCAICYTLKRQDEEHFGGLREKVLERDGNRCRVCDASGRDKRSIVVHHRKRGRSVMEWMIALCPGCHAKVHRTKAAVTEMPPLLLQLWREQHPRGHEQMRLNFSPKTPAARAVPLFPEALKQGPADRAEAQ
jgi:5-methylcytosine-specific restriction endonuclease McrA